MADNHLYLEEIPWQKSFCQFKTNAIILLSSSSNECPNAARQEPQQHGYNKIKV